MKHFRRAPPEQLSMLLSPPFTPRDCCADVDEFEQQACVRTNSGRFCLACYLFGPHGWAPVGRVRQVHPEFADADRHHDDCAHREDLGGGMRRAA